MLLFYRKNDLIFILSGIGIGLTLDSFIPSLLLKTERIMEINAYNIGLMPTIVLLTGIVIIVLLINNIKKR